MAIRMLAAVAAIATMTSFGQARSAPATEDAARVLHMAFPKAYNKLETWRLYGGYVNHLAQCTKMRLVNLAGKDLTLGYDGIDLLAEDKMIALLREGRLQLTQVSTGLVPVAMDSAGGVPFAVRGDSSTGRFNSYRLNLIVRADSPYLKPSDLKKKKIAHTTPGSNSGNLAPRAYFPGLGLEPEKDYDVVFSKGHERSIIGTQYGFWDAAAVASDQFERMAGKGEIRRSDFRVLWSSDPFPASAWVMGGSLPPETQQTLRRCTASYRMPPAVSRLLDGADQFVAIDAMKAYAPVRFVASKQAPAK